MHASDNKSELSGVAKDRGLASLNRNCAAARATKPSIHTVAAYLDLI